MNYPLISEYLEAIKAAEDNFDQLKHLRPVLGEDGEPVMTSGNFAVVFKMKDEQTGKLHAVKCFLKEQEGRAEAYRQIAEELEYVSSTFLTPIKYLDKELFVDSANSDDSEFPVLLMDWVEGQTLDKYIREHIDDQYELSLLAYQFSRLAMWLMPQSFAHGDLKPDNILVKEDGTLVLVDYDGMYVPAMKGQKARELGSPDFRHPSRTEEVFDDHIDDFSLASILLSLKAIALQSDLLEEYGASDRLLFSEKDYRNLSDSKALAALQPLMQDAELASLYSLFILALSQNNLSQVSFRLFNLSRPDRSQYEEENLSTEVTEEDLANAWIDEFGVKYSKDKKKLLKAPEDLEEYSIRTGSLVICDNSFCDCRLLREIHIPNTIKIIGYSAFCRCWNLKSILIPESIEKMESEAFWYCRKLSFVSFFSTIDYIPSDTFVGCGLEEFVIPESITVIGSSCFASCNFKQIDIPENVCKIERMAFFNCTKLESVTIKSKKLNSVGRDVFKQCHSLRVINVPVGEKEKISKLLTEYKDILEEKDLEEEVCLAYCSADSRACEGDDPTWFPYSQIIKRNGKIGVVVDSEGLRNVIIPLQYDTWFSLDGREGVWQDFFDDYEQYYGYFAIKNNDGTYTCYEFDKEGHHIFSFVCESFNKDVIKLHGKTYIGKTADGDAYDDVQRMGYYYGQLGNDNCYFALRKGEKWSLIGSDLKKTYIDYVECDGFQEIGWAPKGYYAILIKKDKYQLCIGKRDGYPLILPNEYDYISMRYCMSSDGCKVEGLCFVIKNDGKWAVCSNDLSQLSPFSFDNVGYMVNSNGINVTKQIGNREVELIYNLGGIDAWNVKNIREFSEDEISAVKNAEVVSSKYGSSVCFFMCSGGQTYIPLYDKSKLTPGDNVDLKNALLLTLCRKGQDDIYRVME